MGEIQIVRQERSPSHTCARTAGMARAVILAVLLALQGNDLHAYRPMFTSDGGIVERGTWVAEIGIDEWVLGGIEQKFLGPNVKINYGFANGWETSAAGSVRMYEGRDVSMGFENMYGDVKRRIREGVLQNKSGPSISVEADVLLPSNAQDETHTGFAVLSSLSTGAGRMLYHANLGLAYSRSALVPGVVWGGAGEYFVTPRISVVTEAFGGIERENLPRAAFLAGLIARTAIGTFDLGVFKRSSDAPDDLSFTVGTTIPLE